MLDNLKKFNDLRKQYNTFIYDSFSVENTEEEIIIKFKFIIENLTSFEPELRILKNNLDIKIDDRLIENCKNAAFHMGLIELISYWKATCSPNVIIKAGYINEEQINWFKKLYFYGLGELFYTNGIKTNIDEFMSVKCQSNEVYEDTINTSNDGYLIPIGGGKDSCVLSKLIDLALPDNKIPRVFFNTGIEYKAILQFVRDKAKEDSRVCK